MTSKILLPSPRRWLPWLALALSFALTAAAQVETPGAEDAPPSTLMNDIYRCMSVSVSPAGMVTASQGATLTFRVRNSPLTGCNRPTQLSAEVWSRSGGVDSARVRRIDDNLIEVDVTLDAAAWHEEWVRFEAKVFYRFNNVWGLIGEGLDRFDKHRILVSNGLRGQDLVVADAKAEVIYQAGAEGNVHITGKAINAGDGQVDDYVEMHLAIDGQTQSIRDCNAQEWQAHGGCPVDEWLSLDAGRHRVEIIVDKGNFVRETNTGNNRAVLELDILGPTADLWPFSLGWTGAPEVGMATTVRIEVLNVGSAASPPSETLLELPDGELRLPLPGLLAGQSHVHQVDWVPAVSGSGVIQAIVDPDGQVVELREDNNVRWRQVTVGSGPPAPQPLPDLRLRPEDVSMAPASPLAGQLIYFTVRLRNEGTAPVSREIRVDTQVGGQAHSLVCEPPLPVGEVCVLTVEPWLATAGTQAFKVEADPEDEIAELDENNNDRVLHFNVAGAGAPTLSCQGTWTLTGIGHQGHSVSQGSVADDCRVYWGMNEPMGCWNTTGSEGLVARWYRDGGAVCPNRVKVFDHPIDGDLEYWITID
ncbi:MAG: CARDB domain-containing protein [Acidobacteriota bacterium]